MIEVWRDFRAFLKRPVLLAPAGASPRAARQVAALFALETVVILLLAGAGAIAAHFGFGPRGFMKPGWSLPQFLLIGALIAPVIEELVFRSWLTGPAGWLLRWPVFVRIRAIFVRFFPFLFWFSSLAFGLLHLMNYREPSAATLFWIIPQTMMGAFLGYARVRWGLWASIAMHAAHNALFILAGLTNQ